MTMLDLANLGDLGRPFGLIDEITKSDYLIL